METVEDGIYEISLGYVVERGDEMGLGGSEIHFAEMCGWGETGCWQFFSQKLCPDVPGRARNLSSYLEKNSGTIQGRQKHDCED